LIQLAIAFHVYGLFDVIYDVSYDVYVYDDYDVFI